MLKKLFKIVGITPKWGNVPVPTENEVQKETETPHKKPDPEETDSSRKEEDK